MTDPEDRFAAVVEALLGEPGVTPPAAELEPNKKFGSNGLKIRNKLFAMLVRGNLVVKLPHERVAELIASHQAEAFDRGQGRPLREWATVPSTSDLSWLPLAKEALDFVGSPR